ncbi:MAG: hypothetical protein P0S95_07965 [Rhabdochlamydiaceae bacterium]|nr:hypothetical protein [Candidatus Amphrikana amoebophyrae]
MDHLTPIEKKQDSQQESSQSTLPKKSFKKVFKEISATKENKKQQDSELSSNQNQELKPSPFSIGLFQNQSIEETTPLFSINNVSEIPPLFDELSHSLEGHMITLIQNKGDTHLSTTFIKEDSIFNGLEINLDHFDTAPHSFNVNLYGTPEAAQVLTENLPLLMAKLEKKLPQMQFQFLPPFIKDERKMKAPVKSQKAKNIVTQVRSSF